MEFINLKAQYECYQDEIDSAIRAVLSSSTFIAGPAVSALESSLSQYLGVRHSIACSSGSDALLLALLALGVKGGDEVITSAFSFIAGVEAIMLLGAKPVFVDVDELTYNLDSSKLERAISAKTKAIIPISLFGQMSDMHAINAIAQKYSLPVIEDGAQSFGASQMWNGINVKSCNASLLGITSFFPSKPLGCYGDGGAVFTHDDELAQKIRFLRNHGQVKRYDHQFLGLNARLDSIQAAILGVKLRHLDSELALRAQKARIYDENLSQAKDGQSHLKTPFVRDGNASTYAQYAIRTPKRAELIEALTRAEIPYAVHYPIPLHLQEVVRKMYPYKKGDFPVSEAICEEILCLPFGAFITQAEQDSVLSALNSAGV